MPTQDPRGGEIERQELERLGARLISAIRQSDVEGLLSLLADRIELGPDEGVEKSAVALELRAGRGRTYAMLFDSTRFRQIVGEERQRFFSPEQRKYLPSLDSIKSVQDHLRLASDVQIQVHAPQGRTEGRPPLVVVALEWNGRPSLEELPNPGFMRQGSVWKLTHLFSISGRGVADPSWDPNHPNEESLPPRLRDEQASDGKN